MEESLSNYSESGRKDVGSTITSNDPSIRRKRGRVTFSGGNPAVEDESLERASSGKPEGEPPWSESQHRAFVGAILEVGLQHASPAVIMQGMMDVPPDVTSERVKSHLQKFRKNKDKNKDDFLDEYDDWMRYRKKARSMANPASLAQGAALAATAARPPKRQHGGDHAASLTWSVISEGRQATASAVPATSVFPPSTHQDTQTNQETFTFPIPTEEELATPLGASIAHLMGVFQPMVQCLIEGRESKRASRVPSSRSSEAAHDQSKPTGSSSSSSPRPAEERRPTERSPSHSFFVSSGASTSTGSSPSSPPETGTDGRGQP
jgi:SHAQKYF class myb-like DNA-binding protein